MEELRSLTVSDDRLDDCREAIGADLKDLIDAIVASGFTIEETLIAISELVAEDFASVMKLPSVH
jgi:hypothetical protein